MFRPAILASCLLICVAAVAAGFVAGRRSVRPVALPPPPPTVVTKVVSETAREMEPFRAKYGPGHNSEQEEEWFIRDFFHDRRGGTFVDVGANHYRNSSKTYYLETKLGWSGIAIEPQREFADGYAQHRPRTTFLPFFVSDVSNQTAKLYVLKRLSVVSSSNEAFVSGFGKPDEVRDVPTITLDDVLKSAKITHPDFISMDIELHEPEALKGFSIDRYRPSLVCIEGLLPVRQAILNYFAEHRYVLVGKYVWVDLMDFYFAPLESMAPPK
jgi:FkbM family methyltransferase